MNQIKLERVGYQFQPIDDTAQQPITLFRDINLELNSAESYAITGASGAGKSSLLTILAAIE
jgi:ABC-type lipoprotein export system ATPase subunit